MDTQKLMAELDDLRKQHQWAEAYEKMKPFVDEYCSSTAEDDWDYQILIRWARTLFDYGKFMAPEGSKKDYFERGLPFAQKAIEVGVSEGHLWYAGLLDAVADLEGYRQRLEASKSVGQHLKKGSELLPENPDVQHAYGKYIYEIADLPWLVQSLAKLLYGNDTLPPCTYEMALQLFLKADQLSPNFYSMNTLHIGKCYYRLQKYAQAQCYLEQVAKWHVSCSDDEAAIKEATQLLGTIENS